MTIIYLRDLPSERAAPALSSHRTEVAVQPNRWGQEPAGHSWLARLREWRRRQHSRTNLSQLSDRMLKDIGITYVEAEREVNKPFWLP